MNKMRQGLSGRLGALGLVLCLVATPSYSEDSSSLVEKEQETVHQNDPVITPLSVSAIAVVAALICLATPGLRCSRLFRRSEQIESGVDLARVASTAERSLPETLSDLTRRVRLNDNLSIRTTLVHDIVDYSFPSNPKGIAHWDSWERVFLPRILENADGRNWIADIHTVDFGQARRQVLSVTFQVGDLADESETSLVWVLDEGTEIGEAELIYISLFVARVQELLWESLALMDQHWTFKHLRARRYLKAGLEDLISRWRRHTPSDWEQEMSEFRDPNSEYLRAEIHPEPIFFDVHPGAGTGASPDHPRYFPLAYRYPNHHGTKTVYDADGTAYHIEGHADHMGDGSSFDGGDGGGGGD